MSMMREGQEWFAEAALEHLSADAVYTDVSSGTSTDMKVAFGRTDFDRDQALSIVIEYEARDFIVPASVLDAAGIVPERGDKITCEGRVYEVAAPGSGQPYRY